MTGNTIAINTKSSIKVSTNILLILNLTKVDLHTTLSHLLLRTGSLCAWNVCTLFILDCQYFTKPLSSVVTIHVPLWLHSILRTGQSWPCKEMEEKQECTTTLALFSGSHPVSFPGPIKEEEKGPGNEANSYPAFCSTTTPRYFRVTCRIDSKLKVRPFQRVNSPLTAPVISRLPSGTHCRGSRFSLILVSVTDPKPIPAWIAFIYRGLGTRSWGLEMSLVQYTCTPTWSLAQIGSCDRKYLQMCRKWGIWLYLWTPSQTW